MTHNFQGLFVYPMLARYPYHRRTSMWVGMLFCFASLFGASYTKNVRIAIYSINLELTFVIQPVSLLALQGVVYSIGGSLLYSPCISYLSEWFVNRRGLANGITLAGSSCHSSPYLSRFIFVNRNCCWRIDTSADHSYAYFQIRRGACAPDPRCWHCNHPYSTYSACQAPPSGV